MEGQGRRYSLELLMKPSQFYPKLETYLCDFELQEDPIQMPGAFLPLVEQPSGRP